MKKFHSQFRCLLVASLFSGISFFANAAETNLEKWPEDLSLINLIATPERYDGHLVSVTGHVTVRLEDMSICFAKVTYSGKDCIWINIDSGPFETQDDIKRLDKRMKILNQFNGKTAVIVARFDQKNKGHLRQWSGALTDIVRIYGKNKDYTFKDQASKK